MNNCIQAAFSSGGGGAGVSLSHQEDVLSSSDSTTSTTYVSSSLSLTAADRTDGLCLCMSVITGMNDTASAESAFVWFDDGTTTTGDQQGTSEGVNARMPMNPTQIIELNGSVMNIRYKSLGAGNTTTIYYSSDNTEPKILMLEIS